MANINMTFKGSVSIGKMFDIHDNQNVTINQQLPSSAADNEPKAEQEAPQEQPAAEKPMPADCKKAADDFIIHTFTSKDKGVLNSITQIKKAAAVVKLTSPVEVAMLMVIAKEVNAIKAKTTNAEFVRALIGIGLIDFINEKEITKKANGMTHYIQTNPEDDKKVLVPEHRFWKGNKQLAGKKIFDAMTTPDYQQG